VDHVEIEDDLVLRVARRLSPFDKADHSSPLASAMAGRSAERLMREQPEILAFLLAGTAQLDAESRAIAVFLGDVILESFRLSGRDRRTVHTHHFVTALRRNRTMALRVGEAHDRFAERYLRHSNALRQPALIRYITGVLLEPDETCAHTVPRDDLGPLFIVLKSVIDVLDESMTELGAPLH
jgi:hypothetical protein